MKLLSPLIKSWEKKYVKKYANQPLKHQPVFIIGAPRTGSTILYQTLTNQLDVLYVDNLICKFHKNFFFGFWLSNKFFKHKAHNCFKSNHGDTSACGLHAPSECGGFWYRWLPADRHFIDYNDITDEMVIQIRDEITAIINYFDKPLIFKNLNAGQRLRLLHKCFPEAKLIFIKRNTLFTAQSILKAKRKVGIADTDFWSVMPKNVRELQNRNIYEQIINQIYFLEKQIVKDNRLFNNKNFLIINYKELEKTLEDVVTMCQKFINTHEKAKFQKAEIKVTEEISLKEDEIKAFQEQIEKLDWVNYSDK
ncbi:MAG: sulfotransferase [Desulfurella sp.]|jgi:hypothetical protein